MSGQSTQISPKLEQKYDRTSGIRTPSSVYEAADTYIGLLLCTHCFFFWQDSTT